MEILEIIFAVLEGCGCLLELFAAASTVSAGAAGVKVREKLKQRRAAKQQGTAKEQEGLAFPAKEPDKTTWSYERTMWLFLVLVVLATFLVGSTLWKWLR